MMEWREICKGSWQEFPNLKNCRILFSNGEFIPFQHGFGNTLKNSMFLHRFARKKSNDLKFAVDFFPVNLVCQNDIFSFFDKRFLLRSTKLRKIL